MPKMNNKWIAVCSAAIGVIYSAGYVVTDPGNHGTAQAASQQTQTTAPDSTKKANSKSSNGDSQFHHRHRWNSDHHNDGQSSNAKQPNSKTNSNSNSKSSSNSNSGQAQNTTPSKKSTSPSKSSSTYKDGSYSGAGMNRYGVVQVSVAVKNGKIASVQITNCQTHYPESDIQSLPQQVVANQTWNVDIVSGATGSSEDFRAAVENALQKAMQA